MASTPGPLIDAAAARGSAQSGGAPIAGMPADPVPFDPVPGRPSNALVAVVMLLVTEMMFFTGLIGAYIFLRGGTVDWPPPGQPLLPLGVTAGNTVVLLVSAVTMLLATRAARAGDQPSAANALLVTGLLGSLFLVVQGSEWAQLLAHGLTVQSSIYGATFYTLIGAHGLHVVAAVIWLLVVAVRFRAGRCGPESLARCGLYWMFVTLLWVALFALVYL